MDKLQDRGRSDIRGTCLVCWPVSVVALFQQRSVPESLFTLPACAKGAESGLETALLGARLNRPSRDSALKSLLSEICERLTARGPDVTESPGSTRTALGSQGSIEE